MRDRCWFTGRTILLWLLAAAGVVWATGALILAHTLLLRVIGVFEGTAMVTMAGMLFKEFTLRKG